MQQFREWKRGGSTVVVAARLGDEASEQNLPGRQVNQHVFAKLRNLLSPGLGDHMIYLASREISEGICSKMVLLENRAKGKSCSREDIKQETARRMARYNGIRLCARMFGIAVLIDSGCPLNAVVAFDRRLTNESEVRAFIDDGALWRNWNREEYPSSEESKL